MSRTSDQTDRLFKSLGACVAASAVGAVLWQQFDFLLVYMRSPGTPPDEVFEAWLRMLASWPSHLTLFCVMFIVSVTAALPLQALLQRQRRTDYVATALLAAVLGAVSFPTLLGFFMQFDAEPELDLQYGIRGWWPVVGAGIGLVMGSIAWMIRRPDQDV